MNPYEQEIKDRKDKARAVVSITSGGRRLCRQVMARSEAERRINSYDDLLAALKVIEKTANTCCLLYTSPSPRDGLLSRMPSSA